MILPPVEDYCSAPCCADDGEAFYNKDTASAIVRDVLSIVRLSMVVKGIEMDVVNDICDALGNYVVEVHQL